MPKDFKIERVHTSLLELVAELLLSTWCQETKSQLQPPRKMGQTQVFPFQGVWIQPQPLSYCQTIQFMDITNVLLNPNFGMAMLKN